MAEDESPVRDTTLHLVRPGGLSPRVHVIFLHGLNEEWCRSWGFHNEVNWRTVLDRGAHYANIWSLDYRNDWNGGSNGAMSLWQRALDVLGLLSARHSPIDDGLPIVFVAHSFGGLLMKQMLRAGQAPDFGNFLKRVLGLAFYCVPNDGARLGSYAWRLRFILGSSPAIKALQKDNSMLFELSNWFNGELGLRKWKARVFYETQPYTWYLGLIVSPQSADPKVNGVTPLPADRHHNQAQVVHSPSASKVLQTIGLVEEVTFPDGAPADAAVRDPVEDVPWRALEAQIERQRALAAVSGPQQELETRRLQYLEDCRGARDDIEKSREEEPRPRKRPPWALIATGSVAVAIALGAMLVSSWMTPLIEPGGGAGGKMSFYGLLAQVLKEADKQCPSFGWLCAQGWYQALVSHREYKVQAEVFNTAFEDMASCEWWKFTPSHDPFAILREFGEHFSDCVTVNAAPGQTTWNVEVKSGLEDQKQCRC
jgi:hypothetical protein